jgi:6-phosphogluconate dehydrogenase
VQVIKLEFVEKFVALYIWAKSFLTLKASPAACCFWYNWDLNYGEIAKIFRACVHRVQFLQKIRCYLMIAGIANLLLAPYFKQNR